jgi:hypothetical protein
MLVESFKSFSSALTGDKVFCGMFNNDFNETAGKIKHLFYVLDCISNF